MAEKKELEAPSGKPGMEASEPKDSSSVHMLSAWALAFGVAAGLFWPTAPFVGFLVFALSRIPLREALGLAWSGVPLFGLAAVICAVLAGRRLKETPVPGVCKAMQWIGGGLGLAALLLGIWGFKAILSDRPLF